MKDLECHAYLHTYKCNEKDCEGCKYRYSDLVYKLNELAIQTDCPIYLGDKEVDSYIKLSDVINLINSYNNKEIID